MEIAASTTWLPVKGYERLYEVSDKGEVRSLDRVVMQENRGGTVCRRLYKGRLLKPCDNGQGYWIVSLWVNNRATTRTVHQLVAQAFLGDCPSGLEVCHSDGNRKNNDCKNLRYGTSRDNGQDRVLHGRTRPGSQSHLAKLTEEVVLAIRASASSMTRRQLSERFGVPYANLGYILNRRTWTHI